MTDWSFFGYGAIGLVAAVLAVGFAYVIFQLDLRRKHR